MGSYNNEPVISTGNTNNTPVQKSQSSQNNFQGASGQTAVALGTALVNLYIYFQDQMELKGEQITNVQAAAKGQSEAQIAEGQKQFFGALTQGLSSIAMGTVGAGFSIYEAQSVLSKSNQLDGLKTNAPGVLEDLAAGMATEPAAGTIKPQLGDKAFTELLQKDPNSLSPEEIAQLKNQKITPAQEKELKDLAVKYNREEAPLQKQLSSEIDQIFRKWNTNRQIANDFLRAGGELGQGVFGAEAAKKRAEATLDQASQTMAQGAQDVISGAVQQWATLIDLLLQTQTATANVNR